MNATKSNPAKKNQDGVSKHKGSPTQKKPENVVPQDIKEENRRGERGLPVKDGFPSYPLV
ncbi:MAG: hypothetical protein LW878_13325 [Proteobacteria bacterium]|jgi:hypothetical protein|nr:hypothetical protein [Pseudomonadota bacterium]